MYAEAVGQWHHQPSIQAPESRSGLGVRGGRLRYWVLGIGLLEYWGIGVRWAMRGPTLGVPTHSLWLESGSSGPTKVAVKFVSASPLDEAMVRLDDT